MSNTQTPTVSQLYCASALAYGIGGTTPLSQVAPWYDNCFFTAPPTVISGFILPAACLIGQTAGGIILAFRGTVYNSALDWFSDLIVKPSSIPGFPGKIHTGYFFCLMELITTIRSTIEGMLKTNPGSKLYVTGHSKGGGLASLAAWQLTEFESIIPASDVSVTTFASPMCGDTTFASAYQNVFTQTNYINHLDIVSFLPPDATGCAVMIDVVNELPDGKVKTFLLNLLTEAKSWNYAMPYTVVQYIDSSFAITQFNLITFVPTETLDLLEIGAEIVSGNIATVLAAHSHLCGGGYASAICPGICLTF